MRRADYMASIVKQVGKLSTDALRYLDQRSFPWGVIPILKAYDEGELLRRVDCDMEVALAMEEIVRCRDCKYYHDGTNNGRRYTEPHCLAIGELAYGALFDVDENDFCSWAERKTDAHAERLRGEGEDA